VETLHLQDAARNLPAERHSHGLRSLAAIKATRGSDEEAQAAITRSTGVDLGEVAAIPRCKCSSPNPSVSLSARLEPDYAPQPSSCSAALISRFSRSAMRSRSRRPASTRGR